MILGCASEVRFVRVEVCFKRLITALSCMATERQGEKLWQCRASGG